MNKQPEQQQTGPQWAVGIDVGGTKLAAGLVLLESGAVLARRELPTQAERGAAAVLHDTLLLAEMLLTEARAREFVALGVGLGVAELVEPSGAIASDHAIPWRGVDVLGALGRLAPARIESDVRAHALAEARYGAGRGAQLFVFVTVGTGISACLVQSGKPLAGARGNALVFASSPITTTCTQCGTVLQPVLEEFAGGPGMVARYNQQTGEQLARGEELFAAVQAGDQAAAAVVGSAGDALGVGIGWLVNVLDPELVIVGGGLGSAGGLYWERMLAATRAHIWADASRNLPIIPAALGRDAGIIGAAALLVSED